MALQTTAGGEPRLELNTERENVFIGESAGEDNTTGSFNTFIGEDAGFSNLDGSGNTFLGEDAGKFHTTGSLNTFLGFDAGKNNGTGAQNTFIGGGSGSSNLTGSGNVFLGYNAGLNETGSNKLYIENSNADASNALIYGEFDNNELTINGTLKVNDGTQSEGYVLTSDATGGASWKDPGTSAYIAQLETEVATLRSFVVDLKYGTMTANGKNLVNR